MAGRRTENDDHHSSRFQLKQLKEPKARGFLKFRQTSNNALKALHERCASDGHPPAPWILLQEREPQQHQQQQQLRHEAGNGPSQGTSRADRSQGTQAQHRLVDLVRGTWSAWQRRMLRLLRLLRLYEGHDFMATSPSAATAALRTNPEIQTNSEGPASKLLGRVETQGGQWRAASSAASSSWDLYELSNPTEMLS